MAMQRATIGAIVGVAASVIIATALVSGLLLASQTVPNVGNIKTIGVGVYWDSSCVSPVSSINWGTLASNSSKSITVYVKNNGTAAEILSMRAVNWTPATASSYISLSWDRENQTLNHTSSVAAVLTLSVSANIPADITSFGFDTIITGTEKTA